jgi:hypothetical protein
MLVFCKLFVLWLQAKLQQELKEDWVRLIYQ